LIPNLWRKLNDIPIFLLPITKQLFPITKQLLGWTRKNITRGE